MPRKERPSIPKDSGENIEISFIGFKFKCSNPTSKAIIILVILLVFFVVVGVLIPRITVLRILSG